MGFGGGRVMMEKEEAELIIYPPPPSAVTSWMLSAEGKAKEKGKQHRISCRVFCDDAYTGDDDGVIHQSSQNKHSINRNAVSRVPRAACSCRMPCSVNKQECRKLCNQ